jgi:hypothetical protein
MVTGLYNQCSLHLEVLIRRRVVGYWHQILGLKSEKPSRDELLLHQDICPVKME